MLGRESAHVHRRTKAAKLREAEAVAGKTPRSATGALPTQKVASCKLDRRRRLRAGFRTFMLADPRDAPDLAPKFVGYCRVAQRPVWSAMWALRNASNARWAAWLRELDSAGLEPMELRHWRIGAAMPINLRFIRLTLPMQVKMFCRDVNDDPRKPPTLCNELRVGGKGKCRSVGRLLPNWSVERFESMRAASRAVGISTDWLDYLAATCSAGKDGCTWFDD